MYMKNVIKIELIAHSRMNDRNNMWYTYNFSINDYENLKVYIS